VPGLISPRHLALETCERRLSLGLLERFVYLLCELVLQLVDLGNRRAVESQPWRHRIKDPFFPELKDGTDGSADLFLCYHFSAPVTAIEDGKAWLKAERFSAWVLIVRNEQNGRYYTRRK
jgi:hypothetical protein